ncbi:ATP-grasp domain-containing protein [Streptomyces ziwulingensis]|uniref:ATP-grasp domain-containing protein n=1 Tax=Streptomyces ziwulingensis TaxID=1045501 RepID=A0ABP9CY40_9ACTN
MSGRPLLVVGFTWSSVAALGGFRDDRSVVVVEHPAVIARRGLRGAPGRAAVLREVVAWDHRTAAAADAFADARPDLRPAAVAAVSDDGAPFAARLAERLALPGAGVAAALLLRDKALLRRVTGAADVPQPEWEEVTSAARLRAFMTAHPGPVVLKPVFGQGSVGARVLRSPDGSEAAFAECVAEYTAACDAGPEPVRMLAERCLRGPEYSVELLVADGRTLFANVTAKELFPGTRPVERGHLVPAAVAPDLAALLRERTERVVRAIGFGTGAVHAEWIVEAGSPHLVECAGRLPGDEIPELIDWAYDVELFRGLWTLLAGDPLPRPPRTTARRASAIRFLHTGPGVVERVGGLAAALAVPHVVACRFLTGPGRRVGPLRSSLDRVAYALTCAPTGEEAVSRAEEALARLTVTTRPETTTAPGEENR